MKKIGPTLLVVLGLGIWVAITRNDIVDFFVEGDDDPWYVQAGRYEGSWRFEGDPQELDDFARGVERIEFRIEDPPPGLWRGKEPPSGTTFLTNDDITRAWGRGACVVGGREHRFHLLSANPHEPDLPGFNGGWLEFEERPPFLTERAYGDGFGIDLEAARSPANDWLFVWFGHNADGSMWGFAYTRVE